MGSGVPLINEYKLQFFKKRFIQTVLGGLKLKLGYAAPCYVFVNQLLLFFVPALLIILGTILIEVKIVSWYVGVIIAGALAFLFTLIVNIISYIVRTRDSKIKSLHEGRTRMFDDEDHVEFDACCGVETIRFITPGRKYLVNVVVFSLASAILCSLGCWYLLPTSSLKALFSTNIVFIILLYVCGLISITIAHYSLTAEPPVEWAIYRSQDPYEILALSRPFHCIVFFIFHIIEWYDNDFALSNQILHVLFVLCPILWMFGVFPPVDAFVLWFTEQVHVFLLGGSAMATDIRTVVYTSISLAFFLMVVAIPDGLVGLIFAVGSGFFLSTNLPALARSIVLHFRCLKAIRPTEQEDQFARADLGFMYTFGTLEFVLTYAVGVVSAGTVGILQFWVADQKRLAASQYVGYAVIALFFLQVALAEMQKVYVFWGLLRNRLFPASAQRVNKFKQRKAKLNGLGYFRRVIVNFVAPYLMVCYLTLLVNWDSKTYPWLYEHTSVSGWDILGVVRAYRWIFQSTQNSLLEMSILHVLSMSPVPATWRGYGAGLQLLVISFVRDRITLFINKFYFYLTTVITSYSYKKQRRSSSRCHILLNIILMPLVLLIILVTTVFATPLVPLFTLPIFVIGFPRPLRMWPGKVGAAANICADTLVYSQLSPEITSALRTAFANGSTDEPSPGKHFLIRYQDRLAWVQVLERGYLYSTISLKGLELQETSCHTTEALQIDDMMEQTFEQEGPTKCCQFNQNPLNTLRPYDAAIIDAYSDAKNQLTGVIDNPDVLKKVENNLPKTLVWVLIGHVYWNHRDAEEGRTGFDESSNRPESRMGSASSKHVPKSNKISMSPGVAATSDSTDTKKEAIITGSKKSKVKGTAKTQPPPSPVLSIKSAWSDDVDSLLQEPIDGSSNKTKTGYLAKAGLSSQGFGNRDMASKANDFGARVLGVPASPIISDDEDDVDDLLDELHTYGGPMSNIGTPKKSARTRTLPKINKFKPSGGLLGMDQTLKSPHSVKLTPPSVWKEMPIEQNKLMGLLSDFPTEWYQYVISFLRFKKSGGKNSQAIANEIGHDDALRKIYSQLVMACHAVIYKLGNGKTQSASHVHKTFSGELPWSNTMEWLEQHSELHALVLHAFRLSVKLSMDEVLLGDTSSIQELHDTLEEYDTDWYIGLERDSAWSQALTEGRSQLFALDYDKEKGVYTGRVLTKQDTPIYISSVSGEAVRGQWANLSAELLYMTNDDDERYSIQAHPVLLRNLTVQAADPPLGYPVYSSDPILVPTL